MLASWLGSREYLTVRAMEVGLLEILRMLYFAAFSLFFYDIVRGRFELYSVKCQRRLARKDRQIEACALRC